MPLKLDPKALSNEERILFNHASALAQAVNALCSTMAMRDAKGLRGTLEYANLLERWRDFEEDYGNSAVHPDVRRRAHRRG